MAVSFADVTDVRIPQGDVTKITDSGGRVLWVKEIKTNDSTFYLVYNVSGLSPNGGFQHNSPYSNTTGISGYSYAYSNNTSIPGFSLNKGNTGSLTFSVYGENKNRLTITGINGFQYLEPRANITGGTFSSSIIVRGTIGGNLTYNETPYYASYSFSSVSNVQSVTITFTGNYSTQNIASTGSKSWDVGMKFNIRLINSYGIEDGAPVINGFWVGIV